MRKRQKGLLIVLDGTDGSGKATQTELLIKRLKKKGRSVRKLDFPQYGEKSAALVEEYLNGSFGTAEEVGPYRASIFYACDRFAASAKIKRWINEDKIVISNRYVTANMGHQGGKIKDRRKRKKYFDWLHNLEYDIFSIPKPDINLILHVDAAIGQKLVQKKEKRGYVRKGRADIHENNLKHLQAAEKVYLEIVGNFPNFVLIECMSGGKFLSKGKISELVWDKLKKYFK